MTDALVSGDYVKERKLAWKDKKMNEFLWIFFKDTVFLLVITVISSVSIGFAQVIKSQGKRSDGNKVKVEYMKKHLVFVTNFNYVWVLFLANSYFMMAYFMKHIEEEDDSVHKIIEHDHNIKNAFIMIWLEDAFVFLVMA
jgi:hypothetical protein